MEDLLEKFPEEIAGSSSWSFAEFYEKQTNKTYIGQWFDNYSKRKINVKNDSESEKYRKLGNEYYIKRDNKESLRYYNKSVIFATYKSKNYGLALANRSAVFFVLKDYESCIDDVKQSLDANYPDDLKPKLLIRVTECYAKLCLEDVMRSYRCYAIDLIEKLSIADKERYIKVLNGIQVEKKQSTREKPKFYPMKLFTENKEFLGASKAVTLKYDTIFGRHILANRDISRGEILFQEPAFIFAPTFLDNEAPLKCYYCLSDLNCFVPCKSCTISVFCNKICRSRSWNEFHQYECVGMQMNLWHDVGIAYPALRALIKGGRGRSRQIVNVRDDYVYTSKFGNEKDNYVYFNDLVTNITHIKNITPILIAAAVVVTYLARHTNFLVEPTELHDLGCLLVKHSTQIAANSSIVEHWEITDRNDLVPSKLNAVAAGIFPSISLMNHSCKANTTIQYVRDFAIVKALHNIKKGADIFNCYGIDYRHLDKRRRKDACKSLYYFTCKCEICSNPRLEVAMFDSFLCLRCQGRLCNFVKSNESICLDCKERVNISLLEAALKKGKATLNAWDPRKEDTNVACSQMQLILYKYHRDLEKCNNIYVANNLLIGNLNNALKYYKDANEIRNNRTGIFSKTIAVEHYNFLNDIMLCLKNIPLKDILFYSDVIEKMKMMLNETYDIFLLYYHRDFINLVELGNFVKYMQEIIRISNTFHKD